MTGAVEWLDGTPYNYAIATVDETDGTSRFTLKNDDTFSDVPTIDTRFMFICQEQIY